MADTGKNRKGAGSEPFDEQFAKEQSRVRRRPPIAMQPARPERSVLLPPPPDGGVPFLPNPDVEATRETMAERSARIESKIQRASAVLSRLRATDARARLLSSAIFRRDETLLDAVLSTVPPPEPLAIVPATKRKLRSR